MKKFLFVFMLIGLAWSTWFMVRVHDWVDLIFAGLGWIAAIILAATGALK